VSASPISEHSANVIMTDIFTCQFFFAMYLCNSFVIFMADLILRNKRQLLVSMHLDELI